MTRQIHKILCPTDLSDQGNSALPLAASLARDARASLLVAHVIDPVEPLVGMPPPCAIPSPDEGEMAEQLESVKPKDTVVPCEHRVVHGDPADTIMELAEKEHIDLIVMSAHGQKGPSRLLMGSTVESVVSRSPCPVLTLKQAPSPRHE
jgi:nucleotide-binding universal stress UspA family protein